MINSKTIEYQGKNYFDDRLFILYLCKGKVDINSDSGIVSTTIYHEKAPEAYVWCVVTFRNCNRYPAFRVDSFYKKDDAISYMKKVEPETPLISLGGKSLSDPVPYEKYLSWKKLNKFKEYSWQDLFPSSMYKNTNLTEVMMEPLDNFKGIR